MPLRVYRVCRAIHSALDGIGAKKAGGRWNSPGYAVVYMAQSISLAVLENLVHLSKQDFPRGYVMIAAEIPDHATIFSEEEIRKHGPRIRSAVLGDRWIHSGASLVLKVRSKVVPHEHNYLLNPQHPKFAEITVLPAVPFKFDARLFRAIAN